VIINMPNHPRIQIIPTIPSFLVEQQRQFSLWVLVGKQILLPSQPAPGQIMSQNSPIFEATLHPGVNSIEVHVVAALPKSQRLPTKPEIELEIFTIMANVTRT
jgi:hypothetical protein